MDFLRDLTVIELSHMVMGPSAGVILGDLGANVIKVEPLGGDKTRYLRGSGAGYFAMFNRNKRSICIDLKSHDGAGVIRDLVAGADILIENFRPGALTKAGLDYKTVAALNPGIIYQSSKGFLSGPDADRVALDEVAQMRGGLAYMTGPPGNPLRAGSSVIDMTGGMFGVIGILAALHDRQATGRGRHITSALFETTAFLVGQHMAQHAVTGTAAAPMPTRISAWAVYDMFDTADGQIFVAVVSDAQWQAFCREFGFDEWSSDPALADNTARVAARQRIIPRLRAVFAEMPSARLCDHLVRAGLPFSPVQRPEDLAADPHLAAGGLLDVQVPGDARRVALPNLPVEADGMRAMLRHDPPEPGQHTKSVLQALGYDSAKIATLYQAGAVAGPETDGEIP